MESCAISDPAADPARVHRRHAVDRPGVHMGIGISAATNPDFGRFLIVFSAVYALAMPIRYVDQNAPPPRSALVRGNDSDGLPYRARVVSVHSG